MNTAKLFSFIILFFFIYKTNAQINAIAGYVYGYSDAPVLNNLIDTFNIRTPQVSSSMRHLGSTHGMELGLRYRFAHLSLEFSWSNSFARLNNRSTAGATEVKNTLSYSKNSFIFGAEIFFGKVGVGGSFDYNTFKIKTKKPGFSPRDDEFSKSITSNHIYLSIELPVNERMSLAFRPYVCLPNTTINFYQTARHLNLESNLDHGQFRGRVVTYGIRILFFNGSKTYEMD
jgi:hypothetical protein